MKVLIATISGGHGIQALGLTEKFSEEEKIVVTSKDDKKDYKTRTIKIPSFRKKPTDRINPIPTIKNIFKSFRIILKEKPDIIFCCGANNSLALGTWGKLFGKKVVAIEANNRVKTPSKSVKLLSRICNEVWITHKGLKNNYKSKEVYKGMIYPKRKIEKYKSKKKKGILVVLSSVDEIKGKNVVKNIPHEKLLEKMGKTKTVVTRGGITAWEAAQLSEEVIVVPIKKAHENHQKEFSEWLTSKFNNVRIEKDMSKYIDKKGET